MCTIVQSDKSHSISLLFTFHDCKRYREQLFRLHISCELSRAIYSSCSSMNYFASWIAVYCVIWIKSSQSVFCFEYSRICSSDIVLKNTFRDVDPRAGALSQSCYMYFSAPIRISLRGGGRGGQGIRDRQDEDEDYYHILGLERNCKGEDIKKAYRS